MAWIESHQTLVHHPKLLRLRTATGWTLNECIGTIHRLWWWTLAYAESGYLGEHDPETVSLAIEARETEYYSHKLLFDVLKVCKFMTENLFIHDWLDYSGRYLKTKYRTANPEKLSDIIDNFDRDKKKKKSARNRTKARLKSDTLTYLPTYLNQPTKINLDCALEEIVCECKSDITCLVLSDRFLEQYVVWTLYRRDDFGKKLTKVGLRGQFKKLAIHGPDRAIEMLQQSIDNEWQGIFEVRDEIGKNEPEPGASSVWDKYKGVK